MKTTARKSFQKLVFTQELVKNKEIETIAIDHL